MRKISAIKKSVDTLSRNTKTLRDKYHAVLCEVAGHAYQHGDPRLFDNILNASSGMARKEMVKWINANGFAQVKKTGVVTNKSAIKGADFADGDAVTAYLLEQAKWYETEDDVEEIVRALDVAARIRSLTTQINNAADKGNVIKVDFKATEEALIALQSVMAANA